MQEGDYSSVSYYQYPPNPNPNPTPNYNPTPPNHPTPPPPTYASAPPFATNTYSASDYTPYPSTYPPYPQNPDPVPTPPTAPSYNPTPIIPNPNPNPNLHSFTPSPVQPTPPFPPYDQHAPYQQQPPYYPPYDQHQTAPNYASSFPTNPNPSPYAHLSSSVASVNDKSYENNSKFDGVGGYFDEPSSRYGGGAAAAGYGRSQSDLGRLDLGRSDLGSDLYGKRPESGYGDSDGGYGYGDGVYAYQGNNKVEPYGARGTGPKSSTWSGFDDFGRPVSFPSGKDHRPSPAKVVRAVPKADTQQDVKSGVQKFRVKLLAESGGQSTMDVLCQTCLHGCPSLLGTSGPKDELQSSLLAPGPLSLIALSFPSLAADLYGVCILQIGLDGIRMLDPSTSRTLRIYPLEQVTRFEVFDPSTFAFWSKSSVDIEPRRIRLQSNSYTTSTILDIVTAATVQLKEIGGRSKPSDSFKSTEQPAEKKKGLADWMNLMRPGSEEKDHWVPDEAVAKCTACAADFNAFHHCRNCGDIFCDKCTHGRIALTAEENAQPVRVCDRCMAEVTQRLSNAKEAASKSVGLQSHEDLAKKLQEEMERNRKPLSVVTPLIVPLEGGDRRVKKLSHGNGALVLEAGRNYPMEMGHSGFRSDGSSGRRMKEVACPTCTVHLQVQVPSSGSETIECGVCQHPFLVTAN
ncbi:hypothetical protein RHSIM_Rhsim06G0018400 [Rhododendron simsii]|uniref:FYVE-type domain-containing protein n=1 Tax=Rhododendron simsii TaxID=118357 RepID=A0A834GV50_RHOSS|nr:hypothetical protein RHSIM_Rhsim06G0018400 [Rhododendron simsii]